ncbi:MAG: HD-GYP domain-containing protein, partial [Oscillospiraceae bacterium]
MKLQKSLITTMADLVENRDENTGGHIQRTAKYVEIIARKLKSEKKYTHILTDKYIEDMVIAAPLHDVGKIHIPDAVLNKPGKLDDNEFTMMKSHAAEGGKIIDRVEESVGNINYLRIAKEMAEYHHERMDGKGYPHGITGEEIPLCAKILAVADVFDALISKRCYKEPMPLDKAFAIIAEESGSHFDTDVANAFLESRSEIEQFINELAIK